MTLRYSLIGAAIGAAIAVPLYFTVPAYADFINWQLQNPLMFIIGIPAGIAFAILTD